MHRPPAAAAPPGAAFAPHDHAHCADAGMAQAEAIAAAAGQRLTPVRRRTLEILLEAHRALGAYDVLDRLAADGYGKQPPVAYRALEFLVDLGLVHRINRLNAFAACLHPGESHSPAFLICRTCNRVDEATAAPARTVLDAAAAAVGFTVDYAHIEALGLCPACREAA